MVSIAPALGPTSGALRYRAPAARERLAQVVLRQRRQRARDVVAALAFLAGSVGGIVGFILI